MDSEELDALVITHQPNVRYLTGFTGSSGMVVLTEREVLLVTDFRYRDQSAVEVGRDIRVEILAGEAWAKVCELLGGSRRLRVGFEAHVVSVQDAQRLEEQKSPHVFVPCSGIVEDLRVAKDPEERDAIRDAATLALEALAATMSRVSVGLRELDVAADLEAELRRRGSEWHPFETIVASGPRSALPHARTTERAIGRGEWLLVDFGARVDGYCADITRTFVVGGHADERQQAVYALVREAQANAVTHMRAGLTGVEADALARRIIDERGFGDAFGHSLGHGLGLEVHEAPRVSQLNKDRLPDGAVVTVEPGVYFPGWGGVRIEDDVYLTWDGATLLSDGKTELQELVT